jgi:hypothetical protein
VMRAGRRRLGIAAHAEIKPQAGRRPKIEFNRRGSGPGLLQT